MSEDERLIDVLKWLANFALVSVAKFFLWICVWIAIAWQVFKRACKNPLCAILGHTPFTEYCGNYTRFSCTRCKCFMEYKDSGYHFSEVPVPVVKHLRKDEPCWDCACNLRSNEWKPCESVTKSATRTG
jgi:hypothetical protein